jgi:hypothetical protein
MQFLSKFRTVAMLFLATAASAQTKEDLFEWHFLGNERSTVSRIAIHWIDAGIQALEDTAVAERADGLRSILKPLLDLREQVWADNCDPAVQAEYDRLRCDDALANQVFEHLGSDYCKDRTIQEVNRMLDELVAEQTNRWDRFSSGLRHTQLANYLQLTEQQTDEIEDHIGTASEEFQFEASEILDELSKDSQRRWKQILSVLNSSQRNTAKTILGEPVEWFRDPQRRHARGTLIHDLANYTRYSSNLTSKVFKEFGIPEEEVVEVISKWPAESFDAAAIDMIDSVVLTILECDMVWNILELVPEQRSQIVPLKNRLTEYGFIHAQSNRFNELIAGKAKLPRVVKEILLPHQQELFQQVELQVRLNPKHDSTVGLLDPRMISFLEINRDQVAEIRTIGERFNKQLSEATTRYDELRRVAESDLQANLLDVLTPEQREKYQAITGRRDQEKTATGKSGLGTPDNSIGTTTIGDDKDP